MHVSQMWVKEPRRMVIASAVAATLLGLGYQVAAGAPALYSSVNALALAIGLGLVSAMPPLTARFAGIASLAIGAALLATAVFGTAIEGAARWVPIGPMAIQPSLVLLPLLVLSFTTSRDRLTAAGVLLAAVAMALQPDRAMAAALLAGVGTVAMLRRESMTLIAAIAALAALIVALLRPDTLPAVPHVDGIIWSGFAIHPLAGAALWTGLSLLLVPAIVGVARGGVAAGTMAAFGATWAAIIAAAAVGNYPTPVVGFGASAILGYVLCLAALPRIANATDLTPVLPSTGSDGDALQRIAAA